MPCLFIKQCMFKSATWMPFYNSLKTPIRIPASYSVWQGETSLIVNLGRGIQTRPLSPSKPVVINSWSQTVYGFNRSLPNEIRSRQWLISVESRQTGLKTSYVSRSPIGSLTLKHMFEILIKFIILWSQQIQTCAKLNTIRGFCYSISYFVSNRRFLGREINYSRRVRISRKVSNSNMQHGRSNSRCQMPEMPDMAETVWKPYKFFFLIREKFVRPAGHSSIQLSA